MPERFVLEAGKTYTNHGGGNYSCQHVYANGLDAQMRNIVSGWTVIAHYIRRYEDGSIEWDYSTGGHFEQ